MCVSIHIYTYISLPSKCLCKYSYIYAHIHMYLHTLIKYLSILSKFKIFIRNLLLIFLSTYTFCL